MSSNYFSEEGQLACPHPLYLDVAAVPEEVRQVRQHLAGWTHRQQWSEEDADALLLAVGEACNNAVNYGRRDIPDPRLIVSCRQVGQDAVQVEVRNQGNGFHPDLPRLGCLPDADEFAVCGRGFGLMMALVDDVQVLSDGENTTVCLRKSRTAPEQNPPEQNPCQPTVRPS